IRIVLNSHRDDLLAKSSAQIDVEYNLPDVPFVEELESGVTGFAYLSSGYEYWNISISQDTIHVVIDLKCGENDFDFWLYNNRKYFAGSSAPGDDHKVIASIPFWHYGDWQIYIKPGENYIGPGDYNLTVIAAINPFNDDPIEGDPRILTTDNYRFSDSSVTPGSMVETEKNETIIASSFYYWFDENHTEYEKYLSLLKLNSSGGLVWNKTFDSNLRGHPLICETSNNFLVVAGVSWGVNDSYGKPLLYRFDQEGNLDWIKEFGEVGWYMYNIDECQDGTIIAVGGHSVKEGEEYFNIGWVTNLFENGTEKWTMKTNNTEFSMFLTSDTCRHMNIIASESLTSGGIALGGYMNPSSGKFGGWLAIMNDSLQIQQCLEFPGDIVLDIQELDENRLLVIGDSYLNGWEIYLKHISMNGQIIRETRIPYEFRFEFVNVVRHNDTSLVFMLKDSSGGSVPPSTCLIFKTDLNGTILWSLDDFHANHRYVSCMESCSDGRVLLVGRDRAYPGGYEIWVATIVDYPRPPENVLNNIAEILVIGSVGGIIAVVAVAVALRTRSLMNK
ncbi:MAG: hypothetical protein ACFFE3_06370, partial [Candidatus Thorarchaeota archaeon]